VARFKPDPLHLTVALDRLGTPHDQGIIIGDHPLDIATGKAAGAMTGGVASGNTPLAELETAGADLVAPDAWLLLGLLGERGLLPPGA
jgi:phosphoglycolate phosphatase